MANRDLFADASPDASTAESASREREELLQLLYLCPVAIVQLDGFGNIVLMNPQGTQLLMTLSADGELENLFDLFAPFAPEVSEMARRFPKRAGKVCEEYRCVTSQHGREERAPRTISITLQKIDFDIFVAVLADVTAIAMREVSIRTSEERLHSVLDGVKEYAICTVDLDGKITSWNRAAERLEGYRSDEVMGRNIDMLGAASGSPNHFGKRLELAQRDGGAEFEGWRVRKDGTRYWASYTISSLYKKDNEELLGFAVVTRDTTVSRRSEDNLRLLASTDPLTGALNRRSFFAAAKILQERCWSTNETMAILFLDIDHFKLVNDTHGHDAGDVVLQRVVAEGRSQIRSSDLLARMGGEEFAFLLTTTSGGITGEAMAERIRKRIAEASVTVGQERLRVTVSIGVNEATGRAIDVDEMLRTADGALYAAKNDGRNRVAVAASPARAPAALQGVPNTR